MARPELDPLRNKPKLTGKLAWIACLLIAGGMVLFVAVHRAFSQLTGLPDGGVPVWKILASTAAVFAILAVVVGLQAYLERISRPDRHKWRRYWTRSRG